MNPSRRLLAFSSTALLLTSALAFTACGGGGDTPTGASATTAGAGGSTGATTSAGATGGGSAEGGGGMAMPPKPMRKKIVGDATWQVTFDDAAKMAGQTDCSYSRHYEGYEDQSAPWLCPSCEIMFRADVTLTSGLSDCFPQVSPGGKPAKVEWLGYDKEGNFLRGSGAALNPQGTETLTADGLDWANASMDLDAPGGGKMGFDISGKMAFSDEEGDVMNGFTPPATYACGWPKADPPKYTGNYLLKKGGTMPDGIFKDACGEPVRLHDLKGSYLFVEMSARNCGPCQAMAKDEEKFIADMKAQNIDVKVVTLLCPALEDVVGETTTPMLKSWIKNFMLTSPVLADRAWGLSMFEPALGVDNVGYPSWTLVDPDLKVLDLGAGFGTFAEIESAILADAMP